MLISCPKCHSVYNISEDRIPEKGKKFKCAECGEIWKVFPEDVSLAEVETPVKPQQAAPEKDEIQQQQNKEVEEMLIRLSRGTKNLFANNGEVEQMSFTKRLQHRIRNLISVTATIALLLVAILIFGAWIAYNYRYEITARLPGMEKVYNRFNIESVYKAKDVIFEDIQIHQLEAGTVLVSGRLYNNGKYKVKILPIKATFINKDGQVETEVVEKLPDRSLQPGFSILFNINADVIFTEIGRVRLSMEN